MIEERAALRTMAAVTLADREKKSEPGLARLDES
jgi:hypothetical protein